MRICVQDCVFPCQLCTIASRLFLGHRERGEGTTPTTNDSLKGQQSHLEPGYQSPPRIQGLVLRVCLCFLREVKEKKNGQCSGMASWCASPLRPFLSHEQLILLCSLVPPSVSPPTSPRLHGVCTMQRLSPWMFNFECGRAGEGSGEKDGFFVRFLESITVLGG